MTEPLIIDASAWTGRRWHLRSMCGFSRDFKAIGIARFWKDWRVEEAGDLGMQFAVLQLGWMAYGNEWGLRILWGRRTIWIFRVTRQDAVEHGSVLRALKVKFSHWCTEVMR